jgi:hypothetical protein
MFQGYESEYGPPSVQRQAEIAAEKEAQARGHTVTKTDRHGIAYSTDADPTKVKEYKEIILRAFNTVEYDDLLRKPNKNSNNTTRLDAYRTKLDSSLPLIPDEQAIFNKYTKLRRYELGEINRQKAAEKQKQAEEQRIHETLKTLCYEEGKLKAEQDLDVKKAELFGFEDKNMDKINVKAIQQIKGEYTKLGFPNPRTTQYWGAVECDEAYWKGYNEIAIPGKRDLDRELEAYKSTSATRLSNMAKRSSRQEFVRRPVSVSAPAPQTKPGFLSRLGNFFGRRSGGKHRSHKKRSHKKRNTRRH